MNRLFAAGLMLVVVGFMLMAISPFLYLLSAGQQAGVQAAGAGCVFLFFVPICFGAGAPQLLSTALAIASLLLVLAIILSILFFRYNKL